MLQVTWYVERRVILARVEGDITLEDVRSLNQQLIAHVDKGEAPVHAIVDLSHVGHVPTNLLKLRDASFILGHDGVGWIVAVGLHNAFMNFLGSMLTQVGGLTRYRVMPTVEAAYAYMQGLDDRLPQVAPRG